MNILQNLTYTDIISPTTSAVTTARTANIDCQDVEVAVIRCKMSIEKNTDNTNVVLSVLHSDDTTVSNFATVTADITTNNAAATSQTYVVDMRGKKRYLRVTMTPDTTTNGNIICDADAILVPATQGAVAANVKIA